MKKMVIVISLLILSLNIVLGEEKTSNLDDYEIQRVTEKVKNFSEPVVIKINFVNIETGDIVKTIDLLEDNPFNNLPFNKELMDKGITSIYSYSGLKLTDIFDDFNWMYTPLYETNINKKIWKADVRSMIDIKTNFACISYSIIAYSSPENMIGQKSIISVFNSKGDEIFRLDNLTDGVSSFALTENGKYLAYLHGQQISEYARIYKDNPGIKIYEIETRDLTLNKEIPFNIALLGIHSKNNVIVYSTREGVGTQNYGRYSHYVVPDEKTIYSAIIPANIFNRLQEYSKQGLILGKISDQDLETELYEFEKHFQKEDF